MTPHELHHLAGLLLNVVPEGATLVGNALGNLMVLQGSEFIGWVDLAPTVEMEHRIHMIGQEAT